MRTQLQSFGGNDPIWGFVTQLRTERYTGSAHVGTDPRLRLFAVDGRVYFAEREGDAPLGTRLVNFGVITATQLERGSVTVGDVVSLARLFHRDPTIDRDAVELTIEMATEKLLETVALQPVGTVALYPLRHHPTGIHLWARELPPLAYEAPAGTADVAPDVEPVVEVAADVVPEPAAVVPEIAVPGVATPEVAEPGTVVDPAEAAPAAPTAPFSSLAPLSVAATSTVDATAAAVRALEAADLHEARGEHDATEETTTPAVTAVPSPLASLPALAPTDDAATTTAAVPDATIEHEMTEPPFTPDTVAEDTVAEDTVVEEPVAEEPVAEEPAIEAPVADEPAPLPTLAAFPQPMAPVAETAPPAAHDLLPDLVDIPAPVLPTLAAEPLPTLNLAPTVPQVPNDMAGATFGGPTHNLAAVEIWEMVDGLIGDDRPQAERPDAAGPQDRRGKGWLRGRKG